VEWSQARRPPSTTDAGRGSAEGSRSSAASAPSFGIIHGAGNRAIASLLRPMPVQRDAQAGPKDVTGPNGTGAGVPLDVRPTLRRGSTGDEVRTVQAVLVARGWPVSVDGQFGAETAAYVCLLQHRWSIDVDATVGRDTWAAVDAELEAGGNEGAGSPVVDAAAGAAVGPGPSTETATSAAAVAVLGNGPAVQRQESGTTGEGSGSERPAPAVDTVGPGSVGPDVLMIQVGLQIAFPAAEIVRDATFGDATEAYVLLYQHDHGLAVDGTVGPETRIHLDPILSMQRHLAASEELRSIIDDLQAMTDAQRASALPQLVPKILAATRTLGERDF
jgi:peptidoglycan hydrolase-like protein with peptidoglycan-binding domain